MHGNIPQIIHFMRFFVFVFFFFQIQFVFVVSKIRLFSVKFVYLFFAYKFGRWHMAKWNIYLTLSLHWIHISIWFAPLTHSLNWWIQYFQFNSFLCSNKKIRKIRPKNKTENYKFISRFAHVPYHSPKSKLCVE